MGLFDINIRKEIQVDKDKLIKQLEQELTLSSEELNIEKNTLLFKNFKPKGTFVNYDLNINLEKSKNSISLDIFGELLNVWIFVIIIVLGILFTYGIGVIIIVLFVYYQKIVATKYLNKFLEDI